jgi:hypothetical protein
MEANACSGGQIAIVGGGNSAGQAALFLARSTNVPLSRLEEVHQLPLTLETSRPGVFCVGDVRSRSVKRVAAAIGEGSTAVCLVYERIEATGLATTDPPRGAGRRDDLWQRYGPYQVDQTRHHGPIGS